MTDRSIGATRLQLDKPMSLLELLTGAEGTHGQRYHQNPNMGHTPERYLEHMAEHADNSTGCLSLSGSSGGLSLC